MKNLILTILLISPMLMFQSAFSQVENPKFDKKIKSTIKMTVPICSALELKEELDSGKEMVILDSRTEKEFETSHIENAQFIDYGKFNKKDVAEIPKDAEIVVYCSIGYRSEKIGEKLKKMGFTNVRNLYGGIFEWVNEDNQVIDLQGNATEKVHTYNKDWSQWLDKGQKVYD